MPELKPGRKNVRKHERKQPERKPERKNVRKNERKQLKPQKPQMPPKPTERVQNHDLYRYMREQNKKRQHALVSQLRLMENKKQIEPWKAILVTVVVVLMVLLFMFGLIRYYSIKAEAYLWDNVTEQEEPESIKPIDAARDMYMGELYSQVAVSKLKQALGTLGITGTIVLGIILYLWVQLLTIHYNNIKESLQDTNNDNAK